MGRKANDLTDLEYGTLRVLYIVPRKGPAKWTCHCAPDLGGCGSTKDVFACSLVRGHTRSCGCLRSARSPIPRFETLITE
jgi:hypothetical protein